MYFLYEHMVMALRTMVGAVRPYRNSSSASAYLRTPASDAQVLLSP